MASPAWPLRVAATSGGVLIGVMAGLVAGVAVGAALAKLLGVF